MPLVDKRYAEALVDAAEDAKALDVTQVELEIFAQMYKEQPEFRKFLHTPEIGNEGKKKILIEIFKESKSIVLPFLELLIDKGRVSNIPKIFLEYIELADKRRNVLHMEIKIAAQVDDGQLARIKEKYRKEYNAVNVKATVTIEPELLGGVVVQIGDRVIDGSIRGRLKGLKDATIKM